MYVCVCAVMLMTNWQKNVWMSSSCWSLTRNCVSSCTPIISVVCPTSSGMRRCRTDTASTRRSVFIRSSSKLWRPALPSSSVLSSVPSCSVIPSRFVTIAKTLYILYIIRRTTPIGCCVLACYQRPGLLSRFHDIIVGPDSI